MSLSTLREIANTAATDIVDNLESADYWGDGIMDDFEYEVAKNCVSDAIVEAVVGDLP